MKFVWGTTAFLLCFTAMAAEPVKLQGLKVSGTVASGTCGAAKVVVSGVAASHIEFSGRAEIVSGPNKLVLQGEDGSFFQDWNMLACVDAPHGPMLVARASCGGRHCIPDNYRVIDPNTARIVSHQNDEEECSAACAEKSLGVRLPEHLLEGASALD